MYFSMKKIDNHKKVYFFIKNKLDFYLMYPILVIILHLFKIFLPILKIDNF